MVKWQSIVQGGLHRTACIISIVFNLSRLVTTCAATASLIFHYNRCFPAAGMCLLSSPQGTALFSLHDMRALKFLQKNSMQSFLRKKNSRVTNGMLHLQNMACSVILHPDLPG